MTPKARLFLRRHLKELAAANDVSLTWIKGWERAEAFPVAREAVLPRIRTGGDYLVALHELGHILSFEASLWAHATDPYGIVLCEGAAWAWASANVSPEAVPLLSEEDWDVVGQAFSSHAAYVSSPEPDPEEATEEAA
jgi:hypothetical protein